MKAHEALIAWSGLDAPKPYAGTVMVSRRGSDPQDDWSVRYPLSNTEASRARFSMRGSEGLAGLFMDFQYLVVEERLDPEVVHEAFMAIDEYAALFGAKHN